MRFELRGSFTTHAAIELYAEVFEEGHTLDKLEAFASFHGADFYRLPRNRETLTIVKESWTAPAQVSIEDDALVPLHAGEAVSWKMAGTS